MMVSPPVAAAQAGYASGGGLLDTVKNAISGGAAGATQAAPAKEAGSVGLFDGVLKKALFGGAAGAAMGFLPFIPGGPILGGVVGALGGAAMGVFSNWRKMNTIKQENDAMIAAMGVQADDPQVKQILQSGNVSQLIPLMQQQGAGVQQGVGQQVGVGQQSGAGQTSAKPQQTSDVQVVVDPETGDARLIDVVTGEVVQQQGAGSPAAQVPSVVNPGVAPVQGTIAVGGGGPAAAAAGVDTLKVDTSRMSRAQFAVMLQKLEQQVEQLKVFLAEQDRLDELDKAAAR